MKKETISVRDWDILSKEASDNGKLEKKKKVNYDP